MSATDALPDAAPTDPAERTDPATPRQGLGGAFAAQLTGAGLANLGDGLLGTLVPLIALGLTTSPAQISLLSAAVWLPWLLLGLAAGALIDRVDQRRAQVVALSVRAGLLAGAAGLAAADLLSMPLLIALALTYGATEVVADLGATSIVPDLVRRDQLAAANGRIIAVQQVTNGFLGAPLAGALIVVGAGIGLGSAAALAALAAVVLLVGLRGSFRPRSAQPAAFAGDGTTTSSGSRSGTALRRALGEVRDGLAYLWRHPVVRPMAITASVLNVASTGYFAVFILWVVGPTSHVGLTESQFPLLMLGFAVGAIGGSFLAPVVTRRLGEIQTMVMTLTASSALMLVLISLDHGFAMASVLAVTGVMNAIGNVTSMALRQRIVPRDLLGRVGGASRTLSYGLMPLGAIAGGLVAEQWGLVATFVGTGVVSLLACGYLALTARPSMVTDAERDRALRSA